MKRGFLSVGFFRRSLGSFPRVCCVTEDDKKDNDDNGNDGNDYSNNMYEKSVVNNYN